MPRFVADEKLTFRAGGALSAATEAASANKLTVAVPAGLYQIGISHVKNAAGQFTTAGDRTSSTWTVNDSADNASFAAIGGGLGITPPQGIAAVFAPLNLNAGTIQPEMVLKGITTLEARPFLGMQYADAGGTTSMTFVGVFIYLITRSGGAHAQHHP